MSSKKIFWGAVAAVAAFSIGCTDDGGNSEANLCQNVTCPAGKVCDVNTGMCTDIAVDKCKNVTCSPGQECDPATGQCKSTVVDKCADVVCDVNQICDPATGWCKSTAADKCEGVVCTGGQVCNPATGLCEGIAPAICNGKKCPDHTSLDTETCECIPLIVEGCNSDADCKQNVTHPEYCDLATHTCKNGACKDKTWEESYQYCSITGKIVCYEGFCGKGDLDCECAENSVCNESTHRCVAACVEPEGNIIKDWSFENWEGDSLKDWSLITSEHAIGSAVKSKEADSCNTAVRMQNAGRNTVRLEGERIEVPAPAFINGNVKYDCTIRAFGSGKLNVGYRFYDAGGKDFGANEAAKQESLFGSDMYKTVELEISVDPKAKYVQPLIGFHRDGEDGLEADITIDSFVCVPQANICDNVKCGEWEICSLQSNETDENGNRIGTCKPKEGFCSVREITDKDGSKTVENVNCEIWQKCDTTTHTCVKDESKCETHTDCPDGQRCNAKKVCEAGDRCEKVKCAKWQTCDAVTGKCIVPEGNCQKSSQCMTKEKPLCDAATFKCVAIDTVADVLDKEGKPVVDKEGNPVKKPINIVPNGSFENWEKVQFGESKDAPEFDLPVAWYGTEFEVGGNKFDTQFDANNVHAYTKSVRSGTTALQLVNTKVKDSDRFTSEGFDVPAYYKGSKANYDCSYFVRGKGDVKIHSYSSQGEMPKVDFRHIDSEEWERVSFSIRNGKALRLIFYVGSTDASKDHIQIDDVICAPWTY